MSYQHPERVNATIELDQIKERQAAAMNEVYRLCSRPQGWQMSIPAERRDSDIVLTESLMDIPHLIDALQAAVAENEQLKKALSGD